MMRLATHVLINSRPKRLGIPLWEFHENAAKEVYFDTRQTLHAMTTGDRIASYSSQGTISEICAVPYSIRFEPGRDYEVALNVAAGLCRVNVFEIVPGAEGAHRKPLEVFDNRRGASRPGCLTRFRSRNFE